MCNINRDTEAELLKLGLNLIGQAMEASLRVNSPNSSSDVLGAAVGAYQQGKISKSQLLAVINALDEQTYQTRAYTVPTDGHLAEYRR